MRGLRVILESRTRVTVWRALSLATVAGVLVQTPAFSHAACVCERWKGREFLTRATDQSSRCVGGCSLRAVGSEGNTTLWELTGEGCRRRAHAGGASVPSQATDGSEGVVKGRDRIPVGQRCVDVEGGKVCVPQEE